MPIEDVTQYSQSEMPWKTKLIWFAVISILSIVTYFPALEIVTHRDNDAYFEDTELEPSLTGLVLKYYSYNRVRTKDSGDTIMFRPGVFVELGFMRWAVGPENPQVWQLLGLVVHLLACFTLLLLLTSLWPTTAACLFTLFFSVMSAGKFMVEYCHATMFMAALAAVNYSCFLALGYARNVDRRTCTLAAMTVCLTLASFTLEFFAPFSLLILAYLTSVLAWEAGSMTKVLNVLKSHAAICLLLLPPLLYSICDMWDLYARTSYLNSQASNGVLELPAQISGAFNAGRSIFYICAVTGHWVLQNILLFNDPTTNYLLLNTPEPLAGAGGVMIIATIGYVLMHYVSGKKAPASSLAERGFVAMSAAMVAVILLVYVLFRINVRGLLYAVSMPLYPYFFWNFVLAGVCAWFGHSRNAQAEPKTIAALCTAIGVLTVANSLRTHQEMLDKAGRSRPEFIYLSELREFVRAHKDEAGFSINKQPYSYYFFKYADAQAPRYIIAQTSLGHLSVQDTFQTREIKKTSGG